MTHDAHAPTREEVLAGIDRPTLPILRTISLVLAAIGLIVFVIGLFVQPDRVWQALLVNWLYFTSAIATTGSCLMKSMNHIANQPKLPARIA
jgi:pheromone shutdown protein TraB